MKKRSARQRRTTRNRKPIGGGGSYHPNSIGNLLRGGPPQTLAGADNQMAASHGGYAQVGEPERERAVEEILVVLEADAPLRDRDGGLPRADHLALYEAAEDVVQLRRCRRWMDGRGFLDADGRLNGAAVREAELSRRLWTKLTDFGMTPAGRARLGLELVRGVTAGQALSEHLREAHGGAA